jgi:hypothetical protein
MLKKQDMKPGTIVEVAQPKSGLPKVMFGDSNVPQAPEPTYVAVRKSFMLGDGGWGVTSGEKLEIVEGPKRRDGINGVKVKILSNGEVGMVYWCELRASCKLVPAASA